MLDFFYVYVGSCTESDSPRPLKKKKAARNVEDRNGGGGGDRPRRIQQRRRDESEQACTLLQYILDERTQLRQQIDDQQQQINLLKKEVELWREVSTGVNDELDKVAMGIVGVQRHLDRVRRCRASRNADSSK